jgi:hypothetical protein
LNKDESRWSALEKIMSKLAENLTETHFWMINQLVRLRKVSIMDLGVFVLKMAVRLLNSSTLPTDLIKHR